MEAEAEKRKQRLQALRKRKLQSEAKDQTNGEKTELSFRNYTPTDEELQKNTSIATPDDIKNTVEQETRNITKEALEEAERMHKEEIDLFSLAPKRANWDLKRDVEKKLETLDKRTQRAIAEIIRKYSRMRTCLRAYSHGIYESRTVHTNMMTIDLGERLKSDSKTGTGIADAVADAEAAQKMDEADEDEE
ncbi:cwf18 pre-mRNA splicing factor-domain-containing protein [Umbelopsis sp. AD052]|nr:cwf18 pre-mRNA splicing factor-domain-containing protein [Umbelopsis sp. AD052]